jgi:hypothetical protein
MALFSFAPLLARPALPGHRRMRLYRRAAGGQGMNGIFQDGVTRGLAV